MMPKIRKYFEIVLPVIIMALVCYPPGAKGAKIYKWVDEKGVVHFSDRYPEKPEKVKGALEEREIKESTPVEPQQDSELKRSARSPIEYATNCTFTIKGSKKMGTGFFVSSNGYAATSRHVIEESWNQVALLNDESEFPIKIVSMSHKYDLALVMVVTPQKTPHLSLRDPRTLIPGERLFAVGASAGLQATVTDGVFTGFRKIESTEEKVIQFSAPINQGNSGGPLIDEKGNVVGVVSSKYLMRKGVPIAGVGFAIPSEHLKKEFSAYME